MGLVQGQAVTMAYVHVVTAMAFVVACLIPLPLIMRRPRTENRRATSRCIRAVFGTV